VSRIPPPFRPLPDAPLIRVAGTPVSIRVEEHPDDEHVDHVWITLDIGMSEPVVLSVNTISRRNLLAGFDPRIRVGLIRGHWEFLPPRGATVCGSLDYSEIETSTNVFYEHRTRQEMEALLLSRGRGALLAEAWGAPYRNHRCGVHQIHSRRASCAVPDDLAGRDGALKFYFDQEHATELFLFKFCGQP